jgi:O-antigen/teichoic acid export membrane protein
MRFADKVTLNILAKTAGSVLLMVSSIIMTRYLTKESYGTYLQAMLIVNTVILLAFVGLPQSIYYYFQMAGEKRRFIVRNVLVSALVGVGAALFVLLLDDRICTLLGNPRLKEYLPYIAGLILLQAPMALKDPLFFSAGALLGNSAGSVLSALLDYLPVLSAVLAGFGLKGIFLVFLASKGVSLLVFLILLKRCCLDTVVSPPEGEGKDVRFRDQVSYAIPIGIAGYLGVVGAQLDKYVVANGFSPSQFAVYSRGAMEVPFISTIAYLLNDITLPQCVAAYKEKNFPLLLQLMHRNIDKVAKINLPIFAFLLVEAPLLIEIMYTKEYVDATPIFRVYLLSLLFGVTVYNMIPTVSGNTQSLFWASAFSLTTKLVLCMLLVKLLGPVGVAAGVFAGSFVYLCYLLKCSVRILGVGWSEIMPWGRVASILMTAALAGAASALVHLLAQKAGVPEGLLTLCVSFAVFCYSYLFGLDLLGLLRQEDRDFLKRWLRIDPFLFFPRLTGRLASFRWRG